MTHDPLCLVLNDQGFRVTFFGPAERRDPIDCVSCNLIARVRADQTRRDIERAEIGLMGCLTTTRDRVIGMIQEAS